MYTSGQQELNTQKMNVLRVSTYFCTQNYN